MIEITVQGKAKTGKTTTAVAICELLVARGEQVKLTDVDRQFPQFDADRPTAQVITVMDSKI